MRLHRSIAWIAAGVLVVASARPASAQDPMVLDPPTVRSGQDSLLTVVLRDAPDYELRAEPTGPGLRFLRLPDGTEERMSFDSVRGMLRTRLVLLRWRVRADGEGTHVISPPSVEVGGKAVALAPTNLRVLGDSPPRLGYLELRVEPERVVREQTARLIVDVYLGAVQESAGGRWVSPLRYVRQLRRPPQIRLPWIDVQGSPGLPAGLAGTDLQVWAGTLPPGSERLLLDLANSGPSIFASRTALPFPADELVTKAAPAAIEGTFFHGRYEYEFRARSVGHYELGPALLSGSSVQLRGDRLVVEDLWARSETLRFEVVEPPEEGRPESWSGAIGKFTVEVPPVVPRSVEIGGEPIRLTIAVHGTGSLEGVGFGLERDERWLESFQIAPPQVLRPGEGTSPGGEAEGLGTNGTWRQFEYSLLPIRPGRHRLPDLEFAWYDPSKERYESVLVPGTEVEVRGSAPETTLEGALVRESARDPVAATAEPADGIAPLIRDRNLLADEQPRPWTALLVVIASWLLFAALAAWRRRVGRLHADPAGKRRRAALSRALLRLAEARSEISQDPPRALERASRALAGWIADRGGVGEEGASRNDILEGLRREGMSAEEERSIQRLLERAEAARFGGAEIAGAALDELQVCEACLARLSDPARGRRGDVAKRGTAMLFLLLALPETAAAQADESARVETFARAERAYDRGEYAEAAHLFESLLDDDYANGALLYDLGNAWARCEDRLAEAIAAYRRALRHRPGDENLRANLTRVLARRAPDAPTAHEPTDVGGLLFWRRSLGLRGRVRLAAGLALCALAAAALRLLFGRGRAWTAVAIGSLLLALVVGAFTTLDLLAARPGRHVVLRATSPLWSGPSEDFEETAAALPKGSEGEILQLGEERTEGWIEVQLGQHRGWIPRQDAVVY